MCTCLNLIGRRGYFGRTLDLECHYDEKIIITPRNYPLEFKNNERLMSKYSFIGAGMPLNGFPLYYEAANECGLAVAGLNFPMNAYYRDEIEGKLNLASFEIIPYLLGSFKSVDEVLNNINDLNITNLEFAPGMPKGELHFMVGDNSKSIVIESDKRGVKIYHNPYNVMTNNPPFDLILNEVNKLEGLSSLYKESDDYRYSCVGLGAVGLPGDHSSISRFLKCTFLAKNYEENIDSNKNIINFFHILDNVSMVEGATKAKNNKNDITFYTACIDLENLVYYYKTYHDNTIKAIRLDKNINSNSLISFNMSDEISFKFLN